MQIRIEFNVVGNIDRESCVNNKLIDAKDPCGHIRCIQNNDNNNSQHSVWFCVNSFYVWFN